MKKQKTIQSKTTTGQKIKFFRERNELTQLQLAQESGIDLSTIARIENDTQNPDKETISLIATALFLNAKETAYLFDVNIYAIDHRKNKVDK